MQEQSFFLFGSDAGNIVQKGQPRPFLPAVSLEGDGKPMGRIPDPLQKIQGLDGAGPFPRPPGEDPGSAFQTGPWKTGGSGP
jgi:hypothetical protein